MRLSDDLVAFLFNYLNNRTVVFREKDARRQPLILRVGTPQGAILTPTLFNLWVSDIPLPMSDTNLSQFAHDIATYASDREARDGLQAFNMEIAHWCAKTRRLDTLRRYSLAFLLAIARADARLAMPVFFR